MPRYRYEALNSSGKPVKGEIEAIDQETAMREVVAQNLMPTGIREIRDADHPDSEPSNAIGRWITIAVLIILAALALLGSLSRTDNEKDRQPAPPETSESPATNGTP